MKAGFFLLHALGGYVAGGGSILYIAGFFADFGVPKSIVDGEAGPLWTAVLTDAGLVALFGLHHSLAARRSFKRWWTRIVPAPIERATYLYTTAGMTALLVVFWQPIPVAVWEVQSPFAVGLIIAAYLATWAMMFAATCHFGHFDFFGLAQAWRNFRRTPPPAASMTTRYLYALVRHPISLGWMLTPWLTPSLTLGHVVFAVSAFLYIMAATPFEEADLIAELGDRYRNYRRRIPAFLPGTGRCKDPGSASATENLRASQTGGAP